MSRDPVIEQATAILDRAQVEFLGQNPTRDQLAAWFNCCLSSGCGPLAERYGDSVTAALLQTWADIARERALAAEAANANTPPGSPA